MADTLEDGRLVVVTADQHTGYGVNDCVDDVVHDYLVDLEVPTRSLRSCEATARGRGNRLGAATIPAQIRIPPR